MSSASMLSRAALFRVYLALLALLAVTAAAARVSAGPWSLPLGLAVATMKLLLIFIFFMGLRRQGGLVRLFAATGFFWIGIGAMLTFSDYLTRSWSF